MPDTTKVRDRYGLPLTAGSATVVERYLKGIDQFLSLNIDAEVSLAQAIEADEAFALAHAALALIQQFQGASDEAKQSAVRACACVAGTSRRERHHVDAIATFVHGGGSRALALVHEHLNEFPRDAVLLFLHSFLVARSGSRDWQQEQFAYLTALAPQYGDDWYFLGHYAFAHHALNHLEESRRLAERALARFPRCGQAARIAWPMCSTRRMGMLPASISWARGWRTTTDVRQCTAIWPGIKPCLSWRWVTTPGCWISTHA
jgi:hypothetical protein